MSDALKGLTDRFGTKIALQNAPSAQAISARQLSDIKAALERAMNRARAWSADAEGWDSIASGLHATFRRARRALRRSRKGEHDLAVLRPRVPGSATELDDRRREELQDKAFALGERLYADKSKTFVHSLEKLWTQWRREDSRDT